MRTLFPKTIDEWLTKKSQFVKLSEETSDPRMARDYEGAISFCDRHIIRLYRNPPKVYKRVKYAIVVISIAVIVTIVSIGLFGCTVARESLHLVGAVGEDVGWIANKAADNIQVER